MFSISRACWEILCLCKYYNVCARGEDAKSGLFHAHDGVAGRNEIGLHLFCINNYHAAWTIRKTSARDADGVDVRFKSITLSSFGYLWKFYFILLCFYWKNFNTSNSLKFERQRQKPFAKFIMEAGCNNKKNTWIKKLNNSSKLVFVSVKVLSFIFFYKLILRLELKTFVWIFFIIQNGKTVN